MRARLLVRWWWQLWRESPGYLVGIAVLSPLSAVLLAGFPWLWQYVVDAIDTGEPASIRQAAVWMGAVGIVHPLLYLVLQGSRTVMNARVEWRARAFVFRHLCGLPPSFYRRHRAGDLVTRLYDDAGEKISWFMCSGVFRTLEASLIVAACLVAMAIIDPVLTAICVLPLPLIGVFQAAIQRGLGRRFTEVQQAISGINDELTTTFGGIRIVQACQLQEPALARFQERARAQRTAEVRAAVLQQLLIRMYGYSFQFAIVALLLGGGLRLMDGSLTLGQYVAFEGFVMTLVWPMFDAGMFVSRLRQTAVALGRLEELLGAEPLPPATGTAGVGDASVVARDLRVVGDDGVVLLDGVDLAARPGELVAVVGEVGSGKSTLIEVLAGARPHEAGSVTVGGRERDEVDRSALRAALGYVPQDPVLLSATLRDNVALGRDVDAATLSGALEASRLAADMAAFPDGLDTWVGERGVTLSGGQQQRVALARALVGGPRVLLLDDATAALDADTEAAFWDRLDAMLPDVAAVVVTHRIATLERADRVLVLESGRAVQEGTHAELSALAGPYRRIYGRYADLALLGASEGGVRPAGDAVVGV